MARPKRETGVFELLAICLTISTLVALDRKIAVLMFPGTQVDDAHVALAHAEHVTRDDFVELDLVEFGLGDRLHAHRRPGISRARPSLPF